jgi:cytochrome P450
MNKTTNSNHINNFEQIPPGPEGNWLVGNLPQLQKSTLKFLLSLARDYGEIARYRIANITGYLVSHPDYIKHILIDNNHNYNKQNIDYQLLKTIAGNGLLTSDGDFWLHQRRLIQPAFHRKRIQGFAKLMTETTLEMLERWQSPARLGRPLDISQEMMHLTLSIVGKALFSQDISGEADVVGKAFTFLNEDISARFQSVFTPPLSWPTPRNLRFHSAKHDLDEVVTEIIQTRRREIENNIDPEEDLLSMLLLARDEETGKGMDDHQLRDEVMTLLLAGHETTANALSWTWYLLSTHPWQAERLQTELARVLSGRNPEVDDLPKLEFTHRVIKESLRLYPPAWIISRKAIEDDKIGGYFIPAGSDVAMSSYVVHHSPRYWENPEGFDPDRFTEARSKDRPSFAYFPFGGGPRLCIGSDFAMLEAQLVLATVAQKFRLDLVPGHPVVPEPLITLRQKYGLKMTLHTL